MVTKEVLINKRPALILAIGVLSFLLISTLALVVNISLINLITLVCIFTGIFFFILFLKNKYINLVIIVSILIILYFAVIVGVVLRVKEYNDSNLSGKYKIEGVVTDVGDTYFMDDREYKVITIATEIEGTKIKVKMPIKTDDKVYLGNVIYANCTIYKNSVYNNGKINATNLTDKVFYSASPSRYDIDTNTINGTINKLKFKILSGLKDCIPYYYGVSYAMLTGETSYIEGELLDNFRLMGIAHIFAVSGLHIAFLFGFLTFIFKGLKLNKILGFSLTAIILFLYIWFCGFKSSCIRAFIIVLVIGFANLLYFKPDRLTAVCIAFIVAVVSNPFDFYSLGFKLSFTVYSALIFFTKPCQEFLSKFLFDKIAKLLAPYIVAYLSSVPLLIDSFGYVSLFSTLFNIAFVPILAFNYILVFILAVAILLVPFYSIFSLIPNLIFTVVIYVINLLNLDMFMLTNITFSISKIPYYIGFIGCSGFFNVSKRYKTIFLIIMILAFISLFICINFCI